LTLPCGFGTDYAGVVDQAGDSVTGFVPCDRVFGGALHLEVDPVAPVPGIPVRDAPQTGRDREVISRITDSVSARLTLPLK
jgi:NADPH:quinone reductase-like Zn-dependent oxidoreductase